MIWFWLGAMSAICADSPLRITEFSAGGRQGLVDEDGDTPDWIEIQNFSKEAVDLAGWTIRDDPAEKFWSFPATNIAPGGFQIVFASGKDRAEPGARFHTNFKLKADRGEIVLKGPAREISAIENYPPQVAGVSFGMATVEQTALYTYLANATPGASNESPISTDPKIYQVERNPLQPQKSDDAIRITATVAPTLSEIASVTLRYRLDFAREVAVPMHDDGQGIFGATIPAGVAKPGQMIRYVVTAEDAAGRAARWPLFANRAGYSSYDGTLIPDSIASRLPVYHLFTPPRPPAKEAATRAVLFHAGELYDNVALAPHGQISSSFPKPSFNLDFPHDHRFRYRTNAARVSDLKILGNFADKSKIRNSLSYDVINAAGSIGHFAFPIRVQHNGEFFCIAEAVEDGDDRWLARVGLD
ncbi:MAG: lamin tail domain-containing protein, partial [Limisphaerales bacterium]